MAVRVLPHEDAKRQPNHQHMIDDYFDEPRQRRRRYRWRRTERYHNHVHHNENADAVQQRASDGMAAQARNPFGAQDKHAGDDKRYEEVNEHAEQCRADTTLECGIPQCAAGDILQYHHKGVILEDTKNEPFLQYKLDDTDNQSTERNWTND